MDQLDWFPFYIDKLLASQRWRLMEDFKRGWYFSLIIESVRSERPGYLKLGADLWRLAGARSSQFFNLKNADVLACFEREEISEQVWIYSERLVRTLGEQYAKLERRRSLSYSPSGVVVGLGSKTSRTDELTERIARLYPGNWRAKGQIQIPQAQTVAIMHAILENGAELVEQGTQAYADAVKTWPLGERKFVMRAVEFFGPEAHYLKDSRIWERSNGRPSKASETSARNDEIILNALRRRHSGRGDSDDGQHDGEGANKSGVRLLAGVARKATAGSD